MWNNENYNLKFGFKKVNNIIIIDIYLNFKKWFFYIKIFLEFVRICICVIKNCFDLLIL